MASVGDGDGVSLNIMPMLDIFSILILFLLMNFSTDPVSHDINGSVELPQSSSVESLDEIPTVVISSREILVNDKKVVTLENGKIPEKFLYQGGVGILFKELEKLRKAGKRLSSDKEKPGVLTMEVHKKNMFALIKRVMSTAQQTEFIEFKLMVEKEI